MALTIVDDIRAQAEKRPLHPALVQGDRVTGYAELARSFLAIGERLREEGVAPGDRCGLLAAQGKGFVELALGILAAGGCLAPIPDAREAEPGSELVRRSRLHHLVRERESGFEHTTLADLGAVDGQGDRAFRALQPAYLRFTSGTTSRRKGVVLGHATIPARLDAAQKLLEIGSEDRILWVLPMAHHFVVSVLLYLRAGATLLLPGGPLPRQLLECATERHATVLYASPHHYAGLAKDTSTFGLGSVRLAISTADGLRAEVAAAFHRRFGLAIAQALGIIEVGLPVANLGGARTKPGAIGRPLPDFEIWLRDEAGQPMDATSPGRTGEICIRGPGMLDAYLDPWLPAAQLLVDGAFATGDQGWLDADGDLHLAGRRANRISMAGMKFFGEEVETVLDLHAGVRESRVFAVAHAHLGEIPVAEIVPEEPAAPPSRDELVSHCRARLASYKVPREFRTVETLARTSSGKVSRRGA